MIGHIGFHGRPGDPALDPWCPGGAEFGYTVFEPERRRGFATEAARGLMDWATQEHAVRDFALTIAPTNTASLGVAQSLGFRRVGSHVDDVDGPEDVFVLRTDAD